MIDPNLTDEQRQAVTDGGGSLLVSAAAGSGKTKVLVERLFRRVEEEHCSVDDFLIITYTRAAAAELRGKIARELSQRVAQQPENVHLRRQLFRVYQADIKTVDAFCGSLLREHIHLLPPVNGRSLTPDYRLLDEQEGAALRSRVLDRVMDRFYEALEQGDENAALLAQTLGAGRDDSRLTELVLELYEKLQSQAHPLQWLQETRNSGNPSQYADGYALWRRSGRPGQWADSGHRLPGRMGECPNKAAYGPAAAMADAAERLRRAAATGWDAAGKTDLSFPSLKAVRGAENEEVKSRMKALKERFCKELKEVMEPFSTSQAEHLMDLHVMAPAMLALLDLAAEFIRALQQEKVRRNAADFSDQEHYAVELLLTADGSPTELARQIAESYVEIMVDEYQDTNEVQNCIFSAISRKGGNLFTVGDVKQSIYRFRLAQPEIFLEKYQSYCHADTAAPGQARKILLTRNFRSRPEVLEATNFIFRHILSQQMGEMDYGPEEQLYPGARFTAAPDRETELHLVSVENTEDEDFDRTRVEADFVAGMVRRMLDDGYPVQGEDGALRPVEPEDIVILMRSPRSRMADFGAAMSRCGIPYSGGERESFFETLEISTVYSLLQIIDNPRQDVPLIAVLRSPLLGFTPDLLAAIRSCGKGDFYDACCACPEEPVQDFLAQLQQLRDLAAELPADQLLWQIYDRLHLLGVFGAMEDGELRRSRLLNLCRYASDLAGQGKITVFELTDYLRSLMTREKEPQIASEQNAGGVQIMSIHRSKGLEFPVVILCDLNHRFNGADQTSPVLVHPRLGLGTERVDTARRVRYPTISKIALAQEMEKEMLSEEMRLLYVAMTRAKEKLILVDCLKNARSHVQKLSALTELPVPPQVVRSAKTMGDWVLQVLLCSTEAGAIHAWAGIAPPVRESAAGWRVYLHENPATPAAARVEEGEGAREPAFYPQLLQGEYTHLEAARIPTKITATQLKGRELDQQIAEGAAQRLPVQTEFAAPKFMQEQQGLTPAERGTAMHLVMQYLPFDTPARPDAVKEYVHSLVQRRLLTTEQGESINASQIAKFLASDLCRQMRGAVQVWREFRFALLVPASIYDPRVQGEEMMLQGVADACFRTAEGLVVADFKTDRLQPGEEIERAERYRPQLEAYSLALSRVLEEPVCRRVLYFFSTGVQVDL
ncbi:MAG: UvrD-helicase domain-containing protein [Oscillospiraceae bacterium]